MKYVSNREEKTFTVPVVARSEGEVAVEVEQQQLWFLFSGNVIILNTHRYVHYYPMN